MQEEYTAPPTGSLRPDLARPFLVAEFGHFCFRCGVQADEERPRMDVDHIVPVARGGGNIYGNYQFLCGPCNSWKGTRIYDFRPGERREIAWDLPVIPNEQRVRKMTIKTVSARAGWAEWVGVYEASRRLKLSPSEIRRRIKKGLLVGDRQSRGPGDTRDRFLVQVPRKPVGIEEVDTTAPVGASATDAQPRDDSERLVRVIDALLHANADTMERQANEIASLRHALGSTQAERDYAQARAEKAETELSQLRHSERRSERVAEQAQRVADAQEARADALAEQLAAAEARASTAESALRARRWRWWPW